MNDTEVTVVGNIVDSPRRVRLENSSVTNFRMASTARRYDSSRQEFVDAGTFWVDVECWGDLGGNVSSSTSKGDPVIVHGALTTHSWETENGRRSTPRIRAFAVGPNLARGSSVFRRTSPVRTAAAADDTLGVPRAHDEEPVDRTGFSGATPDDLGGTDYRTADAALSSTDSEDASRMPAAL